jgi:CRP-like cAMP-binding protein
MHATQTPLRPVPPVSQSLLRRDPLSPAVSAVSAPDNPRSNHLLAALPEAEWQSWSAQLELVEMPVGQVLSEPGRRFTHVHFPISATVSLFNLMANGACSEVATVGNDGMVGVPLLLGSASSNCRAVVQGAGRGYRLRSQVVIDAFDRGGVVMHLLLGYAQALLTQVAQTAACNRHHSVDQQVCRQILQSLDRAEGQTLQMTQELLAGKLGVRRESVTVVALALQREGLIRYARGQVEVLDRAGLEHRSCECYGVIKVEFDRLGPRATSRHPMSHPFR